VMTVCRGSREGTTRDSAEEPPLEAAPEAPLISRPLRMPLAAPGGVGSHELSPCGASRTRLSASPSARPAQHVPVLRHMNEQIGHRRKHARNVPLSRDVLEEDEIALTDAMARAVGDLDLELAGHIDRELAAGRGMPFSGARGVACVGSRRHARYRNL